MNKELISLCRFPPDHSAIAAKAVGFNLALILSSPDQKQAAPSRHPLM
jgi:hypothetical protein